MQGLTHPITPDDAAAVTVSLRMSRVSRGVCMGDTPVIESDGNMFSRQTSVLHHIIYTRFYAVLHAVLILVEVKF